MSLTKRTFITLFLIVLICFISDAFSLPPGSKATTVAAGTYHTLILTEDRIPWGTGYNEFGQLGNGKEKSSVLGSGLWP